jgi:hypothetical protein
MWVDLPGREDFGRGMRPTNHGEKQIEQSTVRLHSISDTRDGFEREEAYKQEFSVRSNSSHR